MICAMTENNTSLGVKGYNTRKLCDHAYVKKKYFQVESAEKYFQVESAEKCMTGRIPRVNEELVPSPLSVENVICAMTENSTSFGSYKDIESCVCHEEILRAECAEICVTGGIQRVKC